jgi:hypothetical protein
MLVASLTHSVVMVCPTFLLALAGGSASQTQEAFATTSYGLDGVFVQVLTDVRW